MPKKVNGRHNSVIMSNLQKQEKMYNIYASTASPVNLAYYSASTSKAKLNKTEIEPKEDASFATLSRLQNNYSPILPSIKGNSPHGKPNFLKQNMSIANQVIRSYRSFSRRHAYNTRFEVTETSEDQTESNTYDLAKDTVSTKAASSPKVQRHNRAKSQMSSTASRLPERVIQVKPIEGKKMLESIQETKESEQQLRAMKNRVEKLMKEKNKALSNIRFAKNRAVFVNKVNQSKDRDLTQKEKYRLLMREKLTDQKEQCAKQRREIKENIQEVKKAKVQENREKKIEEKQIQQIKKRVAQEHSSMADHRVKQLKSSVINHRKQKSQKLEDLDQVKYDVSQIRYHLKNEKLNSTRELHRQEIEDLMKKEQELIEKLKHTLDRQEKIEDEANSPMKFRRAPSLTVGAKFALFQNKDKSSNKILKKPREPKESFCSYVSRESEEVNEENKSESVGVQ